MTVFFCDRDLGKALPDRLRAAGINVERHDDHFESTTTDEEWLQAVGAQGWFALTHNERIRYTPSQRDAVMQHGVGLFVLIGATTTRELAENFIRTLRAIHAFIARTPVPFIAKIYRPSQSDRPASRAPGRVELWLSVTQWRRRHRRRR